MSAQKRVLLIVSGGIAAYKALEVIRHLRETGTAVRTILTRAGAEFVTPLSLQALSEDRVYSDLFSLTDDSEMGHIQLSRDADLLAVVPASADILAKLTAGLADDLATTALLATDKPVLVAPAMNVRMWTHPATQANLATLQARGVTVVPPETGAMACGEFGPGRLAAPETVVAAIGAALGGPGPLAGRRALVTSGPTHEPIDPVRYLANRASGRQGHAIAAALARYGAETTLVTGPVALPDPPGVTTRHVETAQEMQAACAAVAPVDVAVCAAAVADWRPEAAAAQKMKRGGQTGTTLSLCANPDILAELAAPGPQRPVLVVGFAAETESVLANAREKRRRKGCDWILANDVGPDTGTFGGADNTVYLITGDDPDAAESWPPLAKTEVAARLAARIADHFAAGRNAS